MTFSEMLNIGLMQGFAGLSLFAVLLLMGLGLAIIFGQMGVINMAHGEFMTIGAYTIYLGSTLTEHFAPQWMPYYFPLAILLAFGFAFAGGWLVEWALIRHLYKRPLDTLLATWGVSLAMQQCFRSFIGPKEVSPTLPEWLMGSWAPAPGLDIPINGLFVLGLTAVVTGAEQPRHGQRHRHQHPEDRPPDLRHRLRHRRHGGGGLHHHRLDRADLGLALHRRLLPGRHLRRRGQPARHRGLGLRHRPDAVDHRVLPVRLDGQGDHAVADRADPDAAATGPVRQQGPPLIPPVHLSCLEPVR